MKRREKQGLVDQREVNGQTLVFVADRQAEIASQADDLAKKHGAFAEVAALEREHQKTLLEMALEEKRLGTDIQLNNRPRRAMASVEREHRKDLLEIARSEALLAQTLTAMEVAEEDAPTVQVLVEQALRNRDLLRHVAGTETTADKALRASTDEEQEGPKYT